MSYLGKEIKKLGFGLMRLPKVGDAIDIEASKAMVDRFMAEGFTYFDTAYVYGGSEDATKQILVDRYPRESYQLATKLAVWAGCNSVDDAKAQFETSLERTGAGYIDFYLLHNLGGDRTTACEKLGLWNFVKELKKMGKIRHIGFSFHACASELEEILKAHPETEFVQLQINYADWESESVQSRKCYEVARKYNVPVVIMEPVKGGLLANPAPEVQEVFKAADSEASCASWAVRFAAGLDGVITVLSGMSNMEQMEDNISYMKNFTRLSEAEVKTLTAAREAMDKIPLIPCTKCDYCAKVCPENIGISASFSAMNTALLYNKQVGRNQMGAIENNGKKLADKCIKCGKCESVCPQHIEIRNELERVSSRLLCKGE